MKKKRIFSVLILSLISILFIGCSSSSAKSSVKNFMKACVDKDSKTAQQVIQYSDLKDADIDKVMDEVSGVVKDMGGIDSMELKEYSKKDLKDEAIKPLENMAGEDFRIVECRGNSKEFVWLLKKMDGKYFVIKADASSAKEVLK